MASPPIVALNLGMQTLTAAKFQPLADGGLELLDFREFELMPDPAADITRAQQILVGVKELMEALGIKKLTPSHQCLPSQAVFTRFLRLPGNSAEDIRSIIGFEAQQNVPFPIEEVAWDYQILGAEREANWDVVLVAIKNDQINELYQATSGGGLRSATIDVSPMALANAFRYNYSEITGTTLLIDMGARTTNLVFIDGNKVFSRTIPIGGNTISTSIAKELEIDVTLAEELKRKQGYVALGGAYADNPDPSIAKISKVARTTMTRLHAEITRSISYYRANQGGSQPVRAFLCGGSMSMAYMQEFFGEKLPMPVEFFNPLRNVVVSSPATIAAVETKIHNLGELVGCGLRGLGDAPVEINLRPVLARKDQENRRRQPALVAALLALAIALLSVGLFFQTATGLFEEANAGLRRDINRLETITKDIAAAGEEKARVQSLMAPFLLAIDERTIWMQLLDSLADNLPPRFVWVTRLVPLAGEIEVNPEALPERPAPPARTGPVVPGQPTEPPPSLAINAIRIEGLYLENPEMLAVVDRYVDNLARSPIFQVDDTVKTRMVRTQPDGSSWAYSFSFDLPLAQPIALP